MLLWCFSEPIVVFVIKYNGFSKSPVLWLIKYSD
jgi:hypothetical protein